MGLNEKIDELLDIIAGIVLKTSGKKTPQAATLWPIPTPQGLIYWQNEWSNKLYNVFKSIDSVGITNEKLREALKFPSKPSQLLWRIDAIKHSNLDKEQKLYVVERLFDCLSIFRKKDVFCKNGNVIWNEEEFKKYKNDLTFLSATEENRQIVNTLNVALWLYAELLYWTNHPFSHSFHGPYKDEENTIIVKEYFDLKPSIWPFSKDLNFNKIEIFEIYKNVELNKDFKFEFFERELITTENFKKNLESFAVKVNGSYIKSIKELEKLRTNLNNVIESAVKFNESLNIQQMIEQHARMWFYIIKPLCDLVNEEWQPPENVKDNIYKKFDHLNQVWEKIKINFKESASLPFEERLEAVKSSFDPRL